MSQGLKIGRGGEGRVVLGGVVCQLFSDVFSVDCNFLFFQQDYFFFIKIGTFIEKLCGIC